MGSLEKVIGGVVARWGGAAVPALGVKNDNKERCFGPVDGVGNFLLPAAVDLGVLGAGMAKAGVGLNAADFAVVMTVVCCEVWID